MTDDLDDLTATELIPDHAPGPWVDQLGLLYARLDRRRASIERLIEQGVVPSDDALILSTAFREHLAPLLAVLRPYAESST